MTRILILALAMLMSSAWADTRDPGSCFFNSKLGDFKAELATAREEQKTAVMLFFEMDDCPFCARMKATVLNQSDVQDYYRKHFLIFPLDTKGDAPMTDFKGRETREKDFAFENRVRATPVIAFFDLDGKLIVRHTGPTKDKDEFLLLGRYVVEGAYVQMPFAQYKQQVQATPSP
jgi:thioredoxin-related protein